MCVNSQSLCVDEGIVNYSLSRFCVSVSVCVI